jgi:hypothetical protein
VVLENARFAITVRAADPADPQRLTQGTTTCQSEGSIVSLTGKGQELLDPSTPLVWTHFQDYKTPWDGLRVAAGPVRATAVAHKRLSGVYRHGDGEWSVTWNDYAKADGDLYRSFSIYADSPLLDIRDDIVAREVGDNFTMNYRFALRPPVETGGSWESTRTFMIPEDDGGRAFLYDDKTATQANAGWLGVVDAKTRLGLAVFYDPAGAAQASWSPYYPWEPHNKRGTPAWAAAQAFFHIETYNRDVLTGRRGSNGFQVVVLDGQPPAEIAAWRQSGWVQPLATGIEWAPAWSRGKSMPEVTEAPEAAAEWFRQARELLATTRKALKRAPEVAGPEVRSALSAFDSRLAQAQARKPTDPAGRHERQARAQVLVSDIRAWRAGLAVKRAELFARDTGARQRGFTAFTEDTLVKVRPDGPLPEPLSRQAAVALARDEYEGFQVVLVPGAQTVTGLTVAVADLAGPKGARITADHIRRYRVGFVSPAKEGVAETGNEWPDPLIPLPGSPDFPAGTLYPPEETALGILEPGRLAPFWFTVHAPPDAPAGVYKGAVTFAAATGTLAVPVTVTVFAFALPETWSLRADIWFNLGGGFWDYYHSWCTLEEFAPLVRFMDTYRATSQLSWLNMSNLVEVTIEADGRYAFDFGKLKPWYELCLKRGNWFSANLSCNPGWTGHFGGTFGHRTPILDKRTGKTVQFPDADHPVGDIMQTELWKSFWPAYQQFLKENGWLDRCYLENCDEPPYGPGRKDDPRNVELRKFHGALRQLAPELRLFNYGMDPSPGYHGWAEEYVDGWGPSLNRLEESKDYLAAQTKEGKPFVAYICGGSPRTMDRHVPDVYIPNPAIDLRIMPWMTYKYGGSGVMYYSGNSWAGDSTIKYVENVPEKRWPAKPWNLDQGCGFGNGWFTYPAPKMKTVYPSVRLENIRDGIEDYEYLAELERRVKTATDPKKADAAQALLDIEPVVRNVLSWSETPADLRARRAAIARAIEGLHPRATAGQ